MKKMILPFLLLTSIYIINCNGIPVESNAFKYPEFSEEMRYEDVREPVNYFNRKNYYEPKLRYPKRVTNSYLSDTFKCTQDYVPSPSYNGATKKPKNFPPYKNPEVDDRMSNQGYHGDTVKCTQHFIPSPEYKGATKKPPVKFPPFDKRSPKSMELYEKLMELGVNYVETMNLLKPLHQYELKNNI